MKLHCPANQNEGVVIELCDEYPPPEQFLSPETLQFCKVALAARVRVTMTWNEHHGHFVSQMCTYFCCQHTLQIINGIYYSKFIL